jgi:hypothetical protein
LSHIGAFYAKMPVGLEIIKIHISFVFNVLLKNIESMAWSKLMENVKGGNTNEHHQI